jgi:hypothetical protein
MAGDQRLARPVLTALVLAVMVFALRPVAVSAQGDLGGIAGVVKGHDRRGAPGCDG